MIAVRRLLLVAFVGALAGCSHTLPEQDRRITATAAIAKMPAEDLWKEYKTDAKAADKKYWGHALEVSGKVSTVLGEPAAPQAIRFVVEGDLGVKAFLLDDVAAEIVKRVSVGQHLRLKCFCAGLDGDVVLRSCIQPQ
ncbi:MAG TPA: hypothetical protein VJN96_10080 [Vicinamibacterales bacterium]|nr:hypothetical protein [Vicinamibacterales bacterium]